MLSITSGSNVGLSSEGKDHILRVIVEVLIRHTLRPYIYIYTNRSETDEQGVINVSSVRIDYNRNLEKMLNVSDLHKQGLNHCQEILITPPPL